jgi:hypothetical protein
MVAGNWSFTMTTGDQWASPVTIAGSLQSSGSSVTGTVHVGELSCFDRTATMVLTGTLNGDSISLTSTAIDGPIVTLTGNFNNLEPGTIYYTTFTGKYTINGGCGGGLQGSVSGVNVPYIGNLLNGTFQSSLGSFNVEGDIAQNASASFDGSFGITGSVTFDTHCFNAGTIKPGTISSGSFILGVNVTLEVETSNGVLTFLGTLSQDGSEMSGYYTVSGGSCPDKGTAVLHLSSPWDY